jgi:uncharacterized RDD family membrane protein YckC
MTKRPPENTDDAVIAQGEITPAYGKEYFAAYDEPEEEEQEITYPLPEYDETLRYTGFQARVMATTLDMVVVMCVMLLIGQHLLRLIGIVPPSESNSQEEFIRQLVWINVAQVIVYIVYCAACHFKWGTTPGKWLMGARIVSAEDGSRPTTAQWVRRSVGYVVCLLFFGGITFLWVMMNRRKQGPHDRFAGTVVINDHKIYRQLWLWLRRQFTHLWQKGAQKNR